MKKIFLLIALIPSLTQAANWNVDSAKSKLTFTAEQAGEKFNGSFTHFTPQITFNPQALDKTNILVTIDMASVTIEGSDRQGEIGNAEWLNIQQFTSAEFTASGARQEGENYITDGTLNLKGIKKPVSLKFTLREANGITTAHGTAQLNRREFNVGTGSDWESDQWVAFPVDIQFTILATPKP